MIGAIIDKAVKLTIEELENDELLTVRCIRTYIQRLS